MSIKAVIFDLDGTLLDNEGVWEEAFATVAEMHNLAITKKWMKNGWWHEPGIGLIANWKRYGVNEEESQRLAGITAREYRRRVKTSGGLTGVEEVIGAVEAAAEKKLLTALATSSSWSAAEDELEQLGLYPAFAATTTGEEVVQLKPDPEIYNLTAQKLGVENNECLVVEDSIAGVRAGIEAEMKTVGLISEYAPQKLLIAAGATWAMTADKLTDKIKSLPLEAENG